MTINFNPNWAIAAAYIFIGLGVASLPLSRQIRQRFWNITLGGFSAFILACGVGHSFMAMHSHWAPWDWVTATVSWAIAIYCVVSTVRQKILRFFRIEQINALTMATPGLEPISIFEVGTNSQGEQDLRCIFVNKRAQEEAPLRENDFLSEAMPGHKVRQGYQSDPLLDIYLRTALQGDRYQGEIIYDGEVSGIYQVVCEQLGPGCIFIRWNNVSHDRAAIDSQVKAFEAVQAFSRGEMDLWYQPIFRLSELSKPDPQPCAFEGLIRWIHPDGTVRPPIEFLPLLDAARLAPQVFYFTIEKALQALCDRPDIPKIAVNLSPIVILDPAFPEKMLSLIDRYGINPKTIGIEVTEEIVLNAQVSLPKLEVVRSLDQDIAIDDYPTGGNSFGQLTQLAKVANFVKIDRSYVSGIHKNPAQQEVMLLLLAVAQTFDLRTIAEGIEAPEDLAWLQQNGCHYGQGYGLPNGVPAPLSKI